MIQGARLTGHWFLSQFMVVKRSITTLVTGGVPHTSGNTLCCYSLGRQVGMVAFCRSFRPLFFIGPCDLKLLLLSGEGAVFVLHHTLFHSPISDSVWKGTGIVPFNL